MGPLTVRDSRGFHVTDRAYGVLTAHLCFAVCDLQGSASAWSLRTRLDQVAPLAL